MKRIEPAITPINPKRLHPQKRALCSSSATLAKSPEQSADVKHDCDESEPKKFKLCKIVGLENA